MLGALVTLLFSIAAAGIGRLLIGRWIADVDPSAKWGLSGLVGLGAIGTMTLFVGLLPGGLKWGLGIIVLAGLVGLFGLGRSSGDLRLTLPRDARLGAVAFVVLALLFSLPGVLSPSDTVDWDTLAYHLAVPKLWLSAGQIQFVSYIHHSNFPFSVDNLYIWGLTWGGEAGAKAFSLAFFAFGLLSIFGLGRQRYGEKAAWWAATAFAATPMVIWLSGTAYIDVANGLYAGLGIAFVAKWLTDKQKNDAILAGILIGLCAGSKYTGLQILIAALVVIGILGIAKRTFQANFKAGLLIAGITAAIACPWYIKNVLNTGNPVYPFFYSAFGGKNWDAFSEKIYKEQQQTFGAARPIPNQDEPDYLSHGIEPSRLGAAVLGLAYQPGRYIDPAPTMNGGVFFGSLGFVTLAAALFWLISGRSTLYESTILGTIGVALAMWFVLSEQSRYILGLTVPLCLLTGGAIARIKGGMVLGGACVVQALAALFVIKTGRLDQQLQVITGKVTPEDYQTQLVHFYEPSQWINQNVKGKIALYDEVFGYFLDISYFWAGPGHTTEIGYDKLQDGNQLADRLKQLGITHAYIDLSTTFGGDHAARDRWAAAAGLAGAPHPYSADEVTQASQDIRNKFKVLLAEAIAAGRLKPIKSFGTRLVFEVSTQP